MSVITDELKNSPVVQGLERLWETSPLAAKCAALSGIVKAAAEGDTAAAMWLGGRLRGLSKTLEEAARELALVALAADKI